MTTSRAPLGLFEKTRIAAAVGAAVVLLCSIGWMVAEPVDPNLALTFTRSGRAIPAIWPALAVLTVVAGVIGTVLSGPRLRHAGVFAAGIGLAALSCRGGSMQVLLAAEGAVDKGARQAFMKAMLVDTALWSAIMAATWIAVSWAWNWVWGGGRGGASAGSGASPANAETVAPLTQAGWPATIVTAVVALFVVWLTSGRIPVANVLRGQTIAAVAAGLYLGAMAARYFTGIRDVNWYVLAVPIVGLVAYVVGYMSADMTWAQGTAFQYYTNLATTPPHDLARPLPVEYIAVGAAAALAGYWGGDKMEQVATQESA